MKIKTEHHPFDSFSFRIWAGINFYKTRTSKLICVISLNRASDGMFVQFVNVKQKLY